jgi:twitching motility protein PilJ
VTVGEAKTERVGLDMTKTFNELMSTAFRPAIVLMNRLRYAWKFVTIAVILLTPLAVLLRLQFSGTTEQLDFSAKESVGVAYILPAKSFLYAIERRHIFAVAVASGETSYKGDLAEATVDADAKAAALDAVDQRLGGELQTNDKWRSARAAWAKVKESSASKPADVSSVHEELMGIVSSLILDDAGNNSNLILDPDLDSYWLMDTFVIKLPLLGQAVSSIAAHAIRRDDAGMADRVVDLAGQIKLLQSNTSDMINIDLKTAFKESSNPKFGQSPTLVKVLQAPSNQVNDVLNAFAEFIKTNVVVAPLATMGTKDAKAALGVRPIVTSAIEALKHNNEFFDKVGPELDWLALKRVASYRARRSTGLLAASAAGILLAYIFIGFYLSVQTSARALADATRQMIAGSASSIELESRDELGQIANDYNQLNEALVHARNLQEKVGKENAELQANILELLKVVADASDGNLTVRASVTAGALGNVADAFNSLLESLQSLMAGIHKQFERSTQAINAISESAKRMAAGATAQAREVISATELVETMSNEIVRVNDNAKSAAEAAKRTEESALQGSQVVENVIAGMGTLRSNVQAGAKKMKSLGDRSMEITGIVGTIARISEQTNMLALNAAIEAAHAGEHGRGFSVVAEEVRKLAERTASATQEIDKLVKAIHSETTETVGAIEQQTQVVEQESALVSQAGVSLGRIREVSTESAGLVGDISKVANAQVKGTTVVVKAMEQISSIAKQTQEGAQGTVNTVGELVRLSSELTESIRQFKVA